MFIGEIKIHSFTKLAEITFSGANLC